MSLLVALALFGLLLELALVELVTISKNFKAFVSFVVILLNSAVSGIILVQRPSIAAAVLVLVTAFRSINTTRIVEARMKVMELHKRSRRSFLFLAISTILLLAFIYYFDSDYSLSIYVVLYIQLLVAGLLTLSVFVARYIYRYRASKTIPDHLPTVTVCIPARNETADLPQCIESVLASTYPKLEIIVLDDCSHDKTPEIIKKYAHDGVRFVNGKEPRADWLAKNAAYDRLTDEALGDVLIFLGVDVRLNPDSIAQVVGQLNDASMISVLPKREQSTEAAFFIQPIRYWWELGLWRLGRVMPPVLSSFWAIRRDDIQRLGGFEGVKKAVEPEAVFARALSKEKKYAFLIANDTVGIVSAKAPHDQQKTALRKRYPQLRRRPETVFLVAMIELSCLLLPYLLFVWFALQGSIMSAGLTLATCLLLSLANAEVYKLSLRKLWPLGFFSTPALVVSDIVLMIRSMYGYEFGEVVWKERNICLPLLTVEKTLPKV